VTEKVDISELDQKHYPSHLAEQMKVLIQDKREAITNLQPIDDRVQQSFDHSRHPDRSSPVTSTNEFVIHRLKETHDIVHVVTGFGINGISEIGLQGFNLAQNRSPLAVMLIFGSMLSSLQNDEPLEPLLRALAHGFQMGLDAELVVSRKLEEGWERPLKEWREELMLPLDNED
jgi:ubiquinone biosynthesis protein Coq4